MNKKTNATFKVTSWDEQEVSKPTDGPIIKRTKITKTYTGDMVGESTVEYIMVYTSPADATIYGIEQFIGTIDGKKGSFLFEDIGIFENNILTSELNVINNSGTDQLKGLTGTINLHGGHQEEYPIEFNFDFE